MATRKHVHREGFSVTPEELFSILITPSAIREWWSASRAIVIPRQGGIWMAAWGDDEDDPDYVTAATLIEFEAPHQLTLGNYEYYSKTGPLPFDAELMTTFAVEATTTGAALQVTQDGFPGDSSVDDFYQACKQGWHDTFAGIRSFLEGGG